MLKRKVLCLGSQSDTGYVSSSGEIKESTPPDNEADVAEPNDEECGMLLRARPLTICQTITNLIFLTILCLEMQGFFMLEPLVVG